MRNKNTGGCLEFGRKLRDTIERLRSAAVLDKQTVKEAVRDIQRALIAADVEVNLVLNLSREIEKRAATKPPEGISRKEFVIKQTYELLVELMGGSHELPSKPKKILLVGLFGQGKTTTAAKLAHWYAKRGRSVLLVCADVHRAASYEQLQQLANKVNVHFYGEKHNKNAANIVKHALEKERKADLIIVDSAGRDALSEDLMEEIGKVKDVLMPDQIWLVISADIGQVAKTQAQTFHEKLGVNGIIITKMDGSAKAGGALTACAATRAPVYFIGTGEKLDELEQFDAQRYLSRIMGYGDLQGLLEKIKDAELEKELSPEELLKGEFTLKTFYAQLEAARKMGPLGKVAEMLGLSQTLPKEQLELTEEKMHIFKVIMDSMTKQELMHPEVINQSRIRRIARGSGRTEQEVRELLSHYRKTKRMFEKFKKLSKRVESEGLGEKEVQKLFKKFTKKKRFKLR
jgi:signal recognition particle subunit SRP54